MEDIQQAIIKLTIKFQNQIKLPLWALANEHLISAIALNEKPAWGVKKEFVSRLMQIACKIKLADLVILGVGFYQIRLIHQMAYRSSQTQKTQQTHFKFVFAGFGASSEEYLYHNYARESSEPLLRINWATQEGISRLGKINRLRAIFKLISNTWGYSRKCRNALPEMSNYLADLLTTCALNAGPYTFYQLCWNMAKKNGLQEIAFLAPDMAAFAAIDQNIKTKFLQHGLLGQNILIPKFSIIQPLTEEESDFFQRLYSDIKLIKSYKKIKKINSHQNIAIILSPNTFNVSLGENIEPMFDFAQWAKSSGIKIVLRPTIKITRIELNDLKDKFPDTVIDDPNTPLTQSFENWKPKFVLSWRSTGLAIALQYGIIPISFFDQNTNNKAWNMIYPMKNRVLFWPIDKTIIEKCICSQEHYINCFIKLKTDYQIT